MRTPEPLSHARPHRKVLLDPGTLEVWIYLIISPVSITVLHWLQMAGTRTQSEGGITLEKVGWLSHSARIDFVKRSLFRFAIMTLQICLFTVSITRL
jgi:hypothetical protein